MKPARPWMLVHLKIIWQFHAHPVHQKVSRFFGSRYIGDDFFLGLNLVSFNRAVVPLFELSFLTKSQTLASALKQKFLSVCQKRFNKLKKYQYKENKLTKWLLLHTGSGFQWYRTYERGYETSGSPLRFMLRRPSLVECVSVLHGTGVYKASIFFICQYVQPCLSKNPKYTFYTIKSSLTLACYSSCKQLSLIWNRHGLECSRIWKLSGNFIKKCRDFLGLDILGTTFF